MDGVPKKNVLGILAFQPETDRERDLKVADVATLHLSTSSRTVEDAIRTAIKRADQTLRNIRWFEADQGR